MIIHVHENADIRWERRQAQKISDELIGVKETECMIKTNREKNSRALNRNLLLGDGYDFRLRREDEKKKIVYTHKYRNK